MRVDHAIDLYLRTVDTIEVLQRHLQHLRPTVFEQTGGVAQFQTYGDARALDVDLAQATGADRP